MKGNWYIADLVVETKTEESLHNIVHINTVLVKATSPTHAFEKALLLGKEYEDSYLNPENVKVNKVFHGIRQLNVVDEELEHGAELFYDEVMDLDEEKIKQLVRNPEKLNVFQPNSDSYDKKFVDKNVYELYMKKLEGN